MIFLSLNLVVFIWGILVLLLSCVSPGLCDSKSLCGTSMPKPGDRDDFVRNFISLMDDMSINMKDKQMGLGNVSSGPNIYGLAQCFNLSDSECLLCTAQARNSISHCLPYAAGRAYLDGCFLRYDTYDFYSEAMNVKYDTMECGDKTAAVSLMFDEMDFRMRVNFAINNVTEWTSQKGGDFSYLSMTGAINVYASAECLHSIDHESCKSCLMNARSIIKDCAPKADGMAFYSGCFVKYSTTDFLPEKISHERLPYNKLGKSFWLLQILSQPAGIVSCSSALFVFAAIGAFTSYRKFSVKKKDLNSSSEKKLSLNFQYDMLEKATDSFADARKVGQGGAGSVYRGTLPDGKTIAVKRLFFNTSQWVDMLFNEVNLISGAKHKNLVTLLGCSIEGPECLLVYEYLPNMSLDQVLFWKNTTHILSWQQRYNIILGVAEGLSYLHNGNEIKIIHRDIKCSNILLDQNLEPKVADFGLVRCCVTDRTHISTEIKGTLGYMAPEYLVRGQLTEKADVYSFGILVIEIATGRKNSVFSQGLCSILHKVWKFYNSNNITDCVEPGLRGRFPTEEASNVLQIGLLCTQAPISLRPSMDEVVKMLKDKSCVVPSPKQPPFLNASVLSPDDNCDSSTIDIPNLEQQTNPKV